MQRTSSHFTPKSFCQVKPDLQFYSLLTIHYSLFTIHYSLFTKKNERLTMKIQSISHNNNTNFQSLHVTQQAMRKIGPLENDFRFDKKVLKIAEKYEILIDTYNNVSKNWFNKFIALISGSSDNGGVKFSIQAGKKIFMNKNGRKELAGIKSQQHALENMYHSSQVIYGLEEEMERKEQEAFFNVFEKYENENFYDVHTFSKILDEPVIKENFEDGKLFNYKVDGDNSLLTKFFDIIPTKENKNEYNHIINRMKMMKNIDYNQKDSFGISVIEKVMNSENISALNLLYGTEFPYSKELDAVFNNISDAYFKEKVRNLNIKFSNPVEAVELKSEKALDRAIKELESPLCDRKKVIKEILNVSKSGDYKDKTEPETIKRRRIKIKGSTSFDDFAERLLLDDI